MSSPQSPTRLKLVRPVPGDIDIAQAAAIEPIARIAEEAGILPQELEFYENGNYL